MVLENRYLVPVWSLMGLLILFGVFTSMNDCVKNDLSSTKTRKRRGQPPGQPSGQPSQPPPQQGLGAELKSLEDNLVRNTDYEKLLIEGTFRNLEKGDEKRALEYSDSYHKLRQSGPSNPNQ